MDKIEDEIGGVKDDSSLSYKFQRLREKLRQAVVNGELAGKLPGERALAKRFHVNAKTLSKALTDLAAEGLLERSIGRGTFVKGSVPTVAAANKRWLLLCDAHDAECDLAKHLAESRADLEMLSETAAVRPSFLNQINAVIDMAIGTPEPFIRDLIVRNIPVVSVRKEPKTYSTHAVLFDEQLAVCQLGRDLILSGHRRIAAVEPRLSTVVARALRQTSDRYGVDLIIDGCLANEIGTMIENGVTAFVCRSIDLANEVKAQLERMNINIPGRVSLVAAGVTSGGPPCTGYFSPQSEEVNAIVQLLSEPQSARPATLWLAGKLVDRGTLSSAADSSTEAMHVGFHRTAM